MQWWNDLVAWFSSDAGQQVLVSAIIPFVAIVLAGLIAALIGRGATKRLVAQRDHETRAAAVAALISVGQDAVRWHTLTPGQREHAERLANDADIQVRLLPIPAVDLAANWAAHQLNDMRINSVSFSFQAEQTLGEYRDRLIMWLHKPGKARKLFAADLERWRYEDQAVDPLLAEQQAWAQQQAAAAAAAPTPVLAEPEMLAEPVVAAPAAEPEPVAAEPTTAEPVAAEPVADATPALTPTEMFANRYAAPIAPAAAEDAAPAEETPSDETR